MFEIIIDTKAEYKICPKCNRLFTNMEYNYCPNHEEKTELLKVRFE